MAIARTPLESRIRTHRSRATIFLALAATGLTLALMDGCGDRHVAKTLVDGWYALEDAGWVALVRSEYVDFVKGSNSAGVVPRSPVILKTTRPRFLHVDMDHMDSGTWVLSPLCRTTESRAISSPFDSAATVFVPSGEIALVPCVSADSVAGHGLYEPETELCPGTYALHDGGLTYPDLFHRRVYALCISWLPSRKQGSTR
jgi:hypothetical protein